ncbi:hypothetical protein CLRAG_36160 [Clostridium ragsdalei P11]|uniref:Uncharacterized protein n=1 Tax=Clostridium ragsdalei P11 TaxID=1353534 RepID=A0A1A6AIZ7_9CLOT|nr:hypothetical protein CLRAG_36160 [Clostridium ragsdalei P11]
MGHVKILGIHGVMSMVNNIITFIAFAYFLVGLLVNSTILPRLLGVICNIFKFREFYLKQISSI